MVRKEKILVRREQDDWWLMLKVESIGNDLFECGDLTREGP
jgi:hypothetical protein